MTMTETAVPFTADPAWMRAHTAAWTQAQMGEGHLWRSGAACSVIVGKYEHNATLAIAAEMRRSVDTVECRARAVRVYVELSRYIRGVSERKYYSIARRNLSVSHMIVLANAFSKYEFEPRCYFDYLWLAYDGRMSSRELRAKIDEEQGGKQSPVRLSFVTWNEYGSKLRDETNSLLKLKDIQKNKPLIDALKQCKAAIESVTEEMVKDSKYASPR